MTSITTTNVCPPTQTFKTLHLTETEVAWLHAVMQNPLQGEDPHDEDPETRKMREFFFYITE